MATLAVATYLSPYKPIPAAVPDWGDERQATWPASTSTLISAGGSAVLVDALMTVEEGNRLADWVLASGSTLSTVYVTHAHADHFFGAAALLRRIPTARLVSRTEIATAAAEQTAPGYLRVWRGFFPGQIAEPPLVPETVDGDDLMVGTQQVRTILVGSSDVDVSSVVHVPDLDLVISGDVAYNGVHLWLAGSTVASRSRWLDALDRVEQLEPRTVITGHKDPSAPDDHAARVLDESRQYLQDFGAAVALSGSPAELIATMLRRHGNLGNEYTLWLSAHSQYPQP